MLSLINYSISTLYKATSHKKCISASVTTSDLSHTHTRLTLVLLSPKKSERGAAGLASRRNDGV